MYQGYCLNCNEKFSPFTGEIYCKNCTMAKDMAKDIDRLFELTIRNPRAMAKLQGIIEETLEKNIRRANLSFYPASKMR